MPERATPRKDPMAILWASSNRNALTLIARECGCTPQFVHYVLYGLRHSKDGRIERALKALGAPVKCR
jgi:hypothetical protein